MFKARSKSLASFLFLPTFRSLANYRFCLNFRIAFFFSLIAYGEISPIGIEKIVFHSIECQSNLQSRKLFIKNTGTDPSMKRFLIKLSRTGFFHPKLISLKLFSATVTAEDFGGVENNEDKIWICIKAA